MKIFIGFVTICLISALSYGQGMTEEEMARSVGEYRLPARKISPVDQIGNVMRSSGMKCFVLPRDENEADLRGLGLPSRICPGTIDLTLRSKNPFESPFIEFVKTDEGVFAGKFYLKDITATQAVQDEGHYFVETPDLLSFSKRGDGEMITTGSVKLQLLIDRQSGWIHTSAVNVLVRYSFGDRFGHPTDHDRSGTLKYILEQ